MSSESDDIVLIIDDEPDLAEVYSRHLEGEYDVRVALGGEEGLEKLDDAVDVVLLDRKMPDMSGDEVLEEIRARGVGCRVVMVTAVDPDMDVLDMAFDEYLVKPVTDEQLREAVERMLARHTLEERIQEMVALASRLATLEAKLDIDQLERSEAYQQLLDEFYDLRDEIELPESEADYYSVATFRNLQALLDESR